MVEHAAVNRRVVGSSPTESAKSFVYGPVSFKAVDDMSTAFKSLNLKMPSPKLHE